MRTRDEGNALLVAVLTVSVCISLALIGIQVAMSSTRNSGVDRQRVLAVNAAEAGVDSAYTAIQTAGLTPPCSIPTSSVKSGPDTATFTTTIVYYNAAGAVLTCAGSSLPSNAVPAQALITSSAQTNTLGGGGSKGVRKMQALVNLKPVTAVNLDKAIFADGSLSFTNKTTLTGNNGPDADVYSNTDVVCNNNEDFAGNVYSQGSITISNTCTFAGGVWAKNAITQNGNASIAGYAKAGTGNISISGATVGGNLYAAGTIGFSGCSAAGKCFPNNSPGAPPTVPFPVLRGDATMLNAWTTAAPNGPGYTLVTNNVCSGTGNVKDKIVTDYSQNYPSGVIVSTSCAVAFSKDNTIAMKNDVAIVATGGITSSQQVGFASNVSGTVRKLYWIVPYTTSIVRPCTSPGISTDNLFSLTNDVDMFIYSPCSISFSNQSHHIGQIYGGSSVTINNQFNMAYKPLDVFGIDPASLSTLGYTPSIVYKRETR
jgi:Tfp pilus assembly protein PilX